MSQGTRSKILLEQAAKETAEKAVEEANRQTKRKKKQLKPIDDLAEKTKEIICNYVNLKKKWVAYELQTIKLEAITEYGNITF